MRPTPGPWRVAGRYVMALKEKCVCECPLGGVFHAKVDAANARVIALTPEMVAFLRDLDLADAGYGYVTRPVYRERLRTLVARLDGAKIPLDTSASTQ